MTKLTTENVLALRPGHELDFLIHKLVLGLPCEDRQTFPRYSDSPAALDILRYIPAEVGRHRQTSDDYTEERKYYARFTIGPVNDPQARSINAATPELALCKVALLYHICVSE